MNKDQTKNNEDNRHNQLCYDGTPVSEGVQKSLD